MPQPTKSKQPILNGVNQAVRTLMCAIAATGTAAYAQETPKQLDAVVVTGLRASLESALNAKRDNNGIVDVIKAEDMGKFPDSNLAESLQRVPGVVIDRDAGEGRSITVRGLGQDFTRVRINGIEALAPTVRAAPTVAADSTSMCSHPSCSIP
mgnify:CR=1 FL=1